MKIHNNNNNASILGILKMHILYKIKITVRYNKIQ